jgi:hypothetical protein
MDMRSTFNGPMADTSAVTVLLENDGPDARGVVRVSGDMGETMYPVELPRGARKRLLTLPTNNWGDLEFSLETNQGVVSHRMPAQSMERFNGGSILLIGDDSGGLGFLRKQTEGQSSITTGDSYVTAEDAPDRPAAYRSFNAVALGPGSERMNDGTVRALQDFALGGGTIVFFGGASSPILQDPRWANAMPGKDWRPVTLAGSSTLASFGDTPLNDRFTVLAPASLAKGSTARREGNTVLESERGYGLGRVVVLGYSMLDQPLNVWGGRARTLSRFIRGGETGRARMFQATYLRQNSGESSFYGGGGGYSSTTYGPGGVIVSRTVAVPARPAGAGAPPASMPPQPGSDDPFSTTLPPTSSVFGLLALYFVLVVPVSFLVLRKLKKGELAWVTAPLLSLGFAGLLFKSAQSLYAAALSTASQGVVVLQEGAPEGVFFGTSQMFFPRGGTYDLGLNGVDSMSAVNSTPDYMRGQSDALAGFNPVDVGEIKAPRLEANNLAFREVSYVQRIDGANWFRIERSDPNHFRVENLSPYSFKGCLISGAFAGTIFDLSPGASKLVESGVGNAVAPGQSLAPNDPRNFTRWNGRVALQGTISGFRPGPQVGQEVSRRTGIEVVAFAQETLR